ncbi:endonuclease/exonuclease/phosphatase family protein [Zhouia sp. PK063]|uniref:endonuclease/exonuclease/phosphatase family protein n=1 Tax=Zhouia sp. PK063 TaxID=3373602 RepID=UPI0037B34F13
MRSIIIKITLIIAFTNYANSQSKTYKIRTIAFYNVENLFDTINDPKTFDDDRTPNGKDHWTEEHYKEKLAHIAHVLVDIGSQTSKSSPDIIGLSEIENEQVLIDLLDQPELKKHNYGYVHYDSPDERGIDVALFYKKNAFKITATSKHALLIFDDDGDRDYTRDQLLVSGNLDGEPINFIVNHWPSRGGGEAKSRTKREAAATLNKKIIDSLQHINPDVKVISMGDLNDDPTNSSLKKILQTKETKNKAKGLSLYNPMEKMLKHGYGSLAYRDNWNLFDQIFFTSNLLNKKNKGYWFWKAGIFNPKYLTQDSGQYKGYPFRTYSNGHYTGGYSDHFPIYIYLIKALK